MSDTVKSHLEENANDYKDLPQDFVKDRALRYNEGKLTWGLVDFKSLEPMVRVLEYGAEKYAAHNWKNGAPVVETIESLLRHTFALLDGEDNDLESGLPHIGHIQCNAMFLAKFLSMKQFDDRDKRNI